MGPSDLLTTQELLAPSGDEVVPRAWLARLFGAHDHCYHMIAQEANQSEAWRKCCHCAHRQFCRLVVVEGHGPYGPTDLPRTMIWTRWIDFF